MLLDGPFQKNLLNNTDIVTSFSRKNSIFKPTKSIQRDKETVV